MKRRMLVIFVDASHADDVREILNAHEMLGYSELAGVLGRGVTGKKLGSRAFPGSSTLFIAAVSETCARDVTARLEELRTARGVEEGLKVFSLETDELI